ncbi:MAG: peptide chain release factor N(5)-glutamine methyltransferase [Betaproteobacteria bacterium]|nr:peptide chain release factor N(5)-glutamine methyltransferase [Betaproteobacteria bacterium]
MSRAQYELLLKDVCSFFQPHGDKPDETPESVLRALWFHAAGTPMSVARTNGSPLPEIDVVSLERLKGLIEKKRSGVPLAHLTGRQEFLGVELLAGPAALVPRRETEIVARAAIAFLEERRSGDEPLLAIDVCTGSGNLALAFAHHVPRLRVHAADLSPEAIELARANAAFTGLSERVEFHAGDLFAPFEADARLLGRCDLVSCNPPYITTGKLPALCAELEHEPRLAFDGGALGLSVLTRLFKESPKFLKPGGALAFELGLGQGPVLEARLRRLPWVERVEGHRDAEGNLRALLVRHR